MTFTCVEDKDVKFKSLRVIKASYDLYKPNDPCVDFWKKTNFKM